MARPTVRVLALLEILESGGLRSATELAETLAVDERTVRRYIEHLTELDVPVESVQGRYGGYRLAPGYRMPPLMLTHDEALATLLGLVAGRRAGLATSSVTAADSTIGKLRRVLPRELGRQLDALLASTTFTAPATAAIGPETSVMLALAEAVAGRRTVSLRYTDREGHETQRTLQPYGLVAHSGRWYIVGFDTGKHEMRMFRLDRIRRLRPSPGSFEPPADFDAATFVLSSLARVPYAYDVSVLIRGTLDRIRSAFPPGLAMIDEIRSPDPHEPWCRVSIRAERLEWIPPLLASLDCAFEIERPAELRSHVTALAQRLAASAG